MKKDIKVKMKIAFPVIKVGSGSDLYYERLQQALKKEGINSAIIHYHRFFRLLPFFLKLFHKHTDADIIHSNAEYGWIFKEKRKPLVVTIHHLIFEKKYFKKLPLFKKLYYQLIIKPSLKRSLKSANMIIAVSKFTKMATRKTLGNYRIKVIYNGIDTERFKKIKTKSSDKRFKLFFVGNLIKRKGADLLPGIIKKLGKGYVLHYTSGSGTKIPHTFNLSNMIPLGKLSEEDLISEYNKCDALLLPTTLEGFGFSVVEAMACGKPVITSNCSSLPELVTDGENGFLCKIDSISDFVKKIKLLSSNLALIKKIEGVNRTKVIKNFSLEKFAKSYRDEYQNLLTD